MAGFRFDTYSILKSFVYNRIYDWIEKGEMDDVNFDVMVVALGNIDRIVGENPDTYSDKLDFVWMNILAGHDDDFRSLFSMVSTPGIVILNSSEALLAIWKLLFREVFIERYNDLKDMWRKRMIENG
ncbi:MAG: hypothetical protein [Caudoviricetes sp.]|nr:MAG: hypothetical protein [Caudoviricetes sp.]